MMLGKQVLLSDAVVLDSVQLLFFCFPYICLYFFRGLDNVLNARILIQLHS